MPYQPYRTIPRETNPKLQRVSSVPPYPLATTQYPVASSSAPPFDPTSLTAPLITWFGKEDSDITLSGGVPVTWTNHGTTGVDASITGATLGTQNGRSMIEFALNGYGDFTQSFSGQPRAIFIAGEVTKSINNGGYNLYLQQGTGSPTSGEMILYVYAFNPTTAYYWFSTAQGIQNLLAGEGALSTDPKNKKYVVAWVNTGTGGGAQQVSLNGTPLTLVESYSASLYPTGSISASLNGIAGGGGGTKYNCYEVLCYDGEVTSTEASDVIAYLQAKWGI